MNPEPLQFNFKYARHIVLLVLLFLAFSISGNAQCGGDVTIDNEGFEVNFGDWNDGGGDCARSTISPNTGSYSVMIRDNSGAASSTTTDNIDLTAYSSITVNFSFQANSMESGEDFWLQLSNNGGSSYSTEADYNRGTEFNNGIRYNESVTISGPFAVNSRVRFRCDASGNGDQVYLDDIVICGTLAASNNPPTPVVDNVNSNTEALAIDVLGNDTDPDGDNLIITAIAAFPNAGGTAIINNNGTPANPADDFIDYTSLPGFFGVETFIYYVCDDGSPRECAVASVNVTVAPNTPPTAVADPGTTNISVPLAVNVLGNDGDLDAGQSIRITSITSAPDQGGSAVINNNGTPSNLADDYIDFTPSGAFVGVENFTYQICDNGNPNICATAVVSINITTCADGSTTETSPNFSLGSEWKYNDSGANLGTAWTAPGYADNCWAHGNSNLGFGNAHSTVISNHGGITYYFRKHFTVADASDINHLLFELVRDDGAVVYLNGTEIYRSNMPNGTINYTTAAKSNVSGSSETKIRPFIAPASLLVVGDNVLAVEIHQDLATSSDVSFDLSMVGDIIDHSSETFVAEGQYWNYNDRGTDLGTAWRNVAIAEDADDWEGGNAELGYGDGDENTEIDYGSSSSNKFPTYYFRHYFNAGNIAVTDSLKVRLRRDDGAVVYLNGTEVFRSNMPAGTINYSTFAATTTGGTNEDVFFEKTFLASMITPGTNVITVEVHQDAVTSSDISMELELLRDFNSSFPKHKISGTVFLDVDITKNLSAPDYGQGALEVYSYIDKNNNGDVDYDSDPRLFSYITNPNGSYEVEAYIANVAGVKSDVSSTNEDAAQDGFGGSMSLTKDKHKSIISFFPPSLRIDTVSSWKYYNTGDPGDPTWMTPAYSDAAWPNGTADFGFGDPGITTDIGIGQTTYYFRKSFTGGFTAGAWNTARIKIKRDDGFVIYLNGVEIARNGMPEGPIVHSTFANYFVVDEEESEFIDIVVSGVSFNTGANVLAVELHQVNATSSDAIFDMMLYGASTAITDVGYRFTGLDVPQGANIVDAFIRTTSATTTETISTINIEGQDADNADVFSTSAYDISSRPRTSAKKKWSNKNAFVDGLEVKISGIKGIVQEIVNRTGWSSGNAMAFFLSGYENEFYTSDGGYAPELTIVYENPTGTSVNYLVSVRNEDLPEMYNYMTDPSPSVTIGTTASTTSNINIGYIGSTSLCYASSDDEYDGLHIINRFSGKNKLIGSFGASTDIEAIALNANADSLFAVDKDKFGLINVNTGVFTPYGNVVGTATNGGIGTIALDDVDGLAYDLTRDILWATARRNTPLFDLIFIIDPQTGQFVPGVFGGNDYVVAAGGGLLPDLDDIAVNPNTGNLFAMNNDNGNITNLVEIDIATGTPSVINPTGLNDMEGQGFHNDGLFYSTSGREGTPDNAFYQVDTSNSTLNLVGYFESGGDFEGCDCKSGPSVNFIDGYVFWDVNIDSIFNDPDTIESGVSVYLFEDSDSSGDLTARRAPDLLLQSTTSDENGYFAFAVSDPGLYIVVVEGADIPGGAVFTTVEIHDMRFSVNGQVDLNNNFGFIPPSALPVELAEFNGENKGQNNNLFWTTATEINNDYFDVQRSKDAINFETIGQVKGAGNTTTNQHYKFIDEDPYKGVNYYRLQQFDFDKTNDFSKTISLNVKSASEASNTIDFEVWPNPTVKEINLSGLLQFKGEEVSVKITDLNGKVRIQKKTIVDENDVISIQLLDLNEGFYLVELSTDNYRKSIPFIKK